jgi:hypothetical protein
MSCRPALACLLLGALLAPAQAAAPPTWPGVRLRAPRLVALAFRPDGQALATAGEDRCVRVWDAGTGKALEVFGPFAGDVQGLTWQGGRPVALVAEGHYSRLWACPPGGRPAPGLDMLSSDESVSAFSEDGKRLALLRGEPRLLDVARTALAPRLPGWDALRKRHHTWKAVAFGGGLLATLEDDHPHSRDDEGAPVAWVWDVETGALRRRIVLPPTPHGRARQVGLSADGHWLVACDGAALRLYSLATGKEWAPAGELPACATFALSPDGRLAACADGAGGVTVCEPAAGGVVASWACDGPVKCLAFSPDGWRVACGGEDGTVLVVGLRRQGRAGPRKLGPHRLEALWADLASPDSAVAQRAITDLAGSPPEAVPFLAARLRPFALSADRLRRRIAELDDDDFAVRQRAEEELLGAGKGAEPAVRAALARRPPLEQRRRLERILEEIEGGPFPPGLLRARRALAAVEACGGPAARALLREAADAPVPWLAGAARAALRRPLAGRPPAR